MLAHMERDDRRTWSVNEYFSSSGKDFESDWISMAVLRASL
jgi:hypothetical protein